MFSKLALRQGSLLGSRIVLLRAASSAPAVRKGPELPVYPEPDTSIEARLKNWDEANKLFFSPQRDEKNFPLLKRPEECPPTRLGFLPASWFENFYEKTGVTGPYVLFGGLTAFLFSKEVIMIEHQFTHFISFWLAFYFLYYKYGDKLSNYLDNTTNRVNNEMYTKPLQQMKEEAEETVASLEKVEWREEGQKYLWQSKKENVDLQLESAYRQRLEQVHQAVKRRLDYHLEKEETQKRLEQAHMTKWIVDNVVKSITPQQEKDALAKCIVDLKALSQKHQATI